MTESPTQDVIIFNKDLTEEHLTRITDEHENYPIQTVTTTAEFKQVYDDYQNIRRLRIAVDKRSDELVKGEKLKFETEKSKITTEADRVLGILSPIESDLKEKREAWEKSEVERKAEIAKAEADKQQVEFERQKAERDRIKAEQDKREVDIKTAADKLERERQEFEYEKEKQIHLTLYGEVFELKKPDGTMELISPDRIKVIRSERLSFDEAWDNAHPFTKENAKPISEIRVNGETIKVNDSDTTAEIQEKVDNAPKSGAIASVQVNGVKTDMDGKQTVVPPGQEPQWTMGYDSDNIGTNALINELNRTHIDRLTQVRGDLIPDSRPFHAVNVLIDEFQTAASKFKARFN